MELRNAKIGTKGAFFWAGNYRKGHPVHFVLGVGGGGGETVENLTLVLVKAVAEIMQIFCRIGKFEIETVMRYTR